MEDTGLPIALHLDHGENFEICKACVDGGFSSVKGLAYDIDLPNNTWGNDVKESVRRGDVDGSSFGFICQEDRWSKVEYEGEQIYKRSVVKAELLEVSPCTFPAYDSSEISCRSFEKVKEEAKEEIRLEKLRTEARLMQLREENEKEF